MTEATNHEQRGISFLNDIHELGVKVLAVDTETNGKDIRDGQGYVTGVSVAYRNPVVQNIVTHYFPFRHIDSGNYSRATLELLKFRIENSPRLVFHNAKFDLVALRTLGINCFGKEWFCTMVAAHLVNENWPMSKSLESCAKTYLGPEFGKARGEKFLAVVKAFGWAYVPSTIMREYAEMDADLPLRLAPILYRKLMEEGGEKLANEYWARKRQLIEVVIAMEARGVAIDIDFCRQKIEEGTAAMEEVVKQLGGYNPGSTKDLKVLLLEKLQLPTIYKQRKNGTVTPTFDKEALAEYDEILQRRNDPTAELIKTYRGWQKAVSSYYRAYITHISPIDKRIRPNYMHHKDEVEGGTVTGRLSCKDPNLQQIPRVSDKAWSKDVKKAFLAQSGYSLWEADYSQLELRLGAAYAREPHLIEIFEEGRDVFTEMSIRLGMSRQDTKTFVYSTQYGAGVRRIKNVFRITEGDARAIRENYFETYPGFRRISDNASSRAKTFRKVQLWSGRFRHFHDPESEAHKALNAVIQGGAADIVEQQMIRLFYEVDQPSNDECRMLLQVHDSVVFEIKNGTEDKYIEQIRQVMTDITPDFGVRFDVEIKRFGGE